MYRRISLPLILFVVGILGTGATGCSLIGYGIGSSIDHTGAVDTSRHISVAELEEVSPGDSVGVILDDGREIRGVFRAIVKEDSGSYLLRCDSLAKSVGWSDGMGLPGDSIVIVGYDGKHPYRVQSTFVRYDSVGLWRMPLSGVPRLTRYEIIDTLYFGASGDVTGAWLMHAARLGKLPYPRDHMILETSSFEGPVPIERVASVCPSVGGSAKYVGLGVGVLLDVVGIVAVSTAIAYSSIANQWK